MFKPVYYSIHAIRLTSNKKVALPQTQKYNFILYSPKNFLFFLKNLREYLMFSPFFYSYLIASIGSSLAAFFAGYHPKKTPVNVQTAKLIIMLQGSI